MRFYLWRVGWLCLVGLLGLVFFSARNWQTAASSLPPAFLIDSAPDRHSGYGQVLAQPEVLSLRLPEARLAPELAAAAAAAAAATSPPGIAQSRPAPLVGAGKDPASGKIARQAQPPLPQRSLKSAARTGESGQNEARLPQIQRLKIPALRVDVRVVEVPFDQVSWDLQDIQQEVAQLGSLPGKTSPHNLVVAGHVTLRNGSHGPFRYLHWLKAGDLLLAETGQTIQTYRVREQIVVKPEDLSVMENTSQQQLTLITCTDWSEELELFQRRRVVLADLVSIEPRQDKRQ